MKSNETSPSIIKPITSFNNTYYYQYEYQHYLYKHKRQMYKVLKEMNENILDKYFITLNELIDEYNTKRLHISITKA